MSIASEITRLLQAKEEIRQAIENKGVEVSDSALLDEYPALISSIPMEGGDPYYEEFYNMRTNNGTNMDGMFARTSGDLDLRKLDTSNITSMKYMFDYSTASVNIDGWDTSNVTDMNYMFSNFTGSIDISKLDTSNVTNMYNMFYYANTDKTILTGLSFPKCTKLDNMFTSASGTTLDLSSWDISNITNMSSMFYSAKYTRIDLSGWKTTNVTNMGSMFSTYSNPLVELIIPDWDMTNCSHNIFYNSSYVSKLKLIDLSRSNDATITKIASFLPTRTATTYGKVIVPENTSQETYDALIAKYWVPIGAALSPVPTNIEIVTELDEIMPGKSTKVYLGDYEPWNADTNKVELVISDSSIATMTDDNEVISTGVIGDIVIEARIIDTQEVIGTKTISVSETDSYPNQVRVKITSSPSSSATVFKVNGANVVFNKLTKVINDVYSYDAGTSITSVKFDTKYVSSILKLNTSNITSLASAFNNSVINYICTETFDTSKVTGMNNMFIYCNKLTSLDLSNWDTSNVTDMYNMFQGCNQLISLDLSNFDTRNVTNMSGMFNSCTSLATLNLNNFNVDIIDDSNKYNNIFQSCSSLHTIRMDNCNNETINKIITSSGISTNIIEGVTRTIYCKEKSVGGLTPPTNWVFSFVEDNSPIPLYVAGEFLNNEKITSANVMVDESHTDLSNMFNKCYHLRLIYNIQDWDTSNVTYMNNMFYLCNSLTSLDISNFNTSNVTDMEAMFRNCNSLTSLDVSNWDTSNVTNMSYMFAYCESLTTLNLSRWRTDNVTTMYNMFYNCNNLTTLDISNWDINNVTDMSSMFYECCKLTNLTAPKNIRIQLNLTDCPLTHESLMSVINNLATVTELKMLTLGAANLAKLTDEEKAIATNKNWILI